MKVFATEATDIVFEGEFRHLAKGDVADVDEKVFEAHKATLRPISSGGEGVRGITGDVKSGEETIR